MEQGSQPARADTPPQPPRNARGRRTSMVGLLLVAPLLALAVFATVVALALATPAGTRMTLEWLAARTHDRLSVEGISGTAWAGLSVARARWVDPSASVEVEDLALRLSWSSVLQRALVIDELGARRVRIALPASDSPATLPETLRLPVSLEVRALRVTAIEWSQGSSPPFALGPVSLTAAYAGGRYRVSDLDAQAFGVRLSRGWIELGDAAPFAVRASARLSADLARLTILDEMLRARLPDRPLTMSLEIAGSLQRLQISAEADYADARLKASGSLDPLAPLPLLPIEGRIDSVDPSQFESTAPAASISGTFIVRPADAAIDVDLFNSTPGRIDERRLPIERMRSGIRWRDSVLHLADVDLRTADGGQMTGAVQADTSRRVKLMSQEFPALTADLQIQGLVPVAQHAGWPALRLNARLQVDRERVRIDMPDVLGDRSLALTAAVSLKDAQAGIDRLEVKSPDAHARLAGTVGLASPHAFSIEGTVDGVDPRQLLERFGLEAPRQSAGNLNAEVRVRGELASPSRSFNGRIALRDSRVAGQPLAASMTAAYQHDPRRLSLDARFDWGGNGLTLRGALGRPDDQLRLTARLNRPELFDRRLAGTVQADAVVGGAIERPRFALRASTQGLAWAGVAAVDAADVAAEAQDARAVLDSLQAAFTTAVAPSAAPTGATSPEPAATEGGIIRLSLSAREIRAAGQSVQRLRAQATGTLAVHVLELSARALNHEIAIAAAGRTPSHAPAAASASSTDDVPPIWSAQLTSLAITGPVAATLVRPGQIELLPGALQVKDLALGADGGVLSLDDLFVSATELRTRGAASALSLRPLIDWLEGGASTRGPSAGSAADARGDAAERLRALRLDARWAVSGPGWDRLDGELLASLKAQSRAVRSDPASSAADPVIGDNQIDIKLNAGQLAGEANVAIPSLRFSRRYTAPDWTLDGELLFSGQIRGTLRSPALVGALRAQGLTLFNRSLGWRLRDGRIAARFDGHELSIDTLQFASGDGAMTVAGALRLVDRPAGSSRARSDLPVEGRLQLDARRLPVPLGPGQRLLFSGLTDLVASGGQLLWRGALRADEGLIELRSGGVPDLPADIRIVGEAAPPTTEQPTGEAARGWTPRVGADLTIALGDSLRVRGGGVDARLGGELTLSGVLPAAPRVRGLVDVRDGTFSAYGRRLEITRGLIRFAGELDNPVLDIVAMRRDQQVEAGVSVTGSALAPRIRLVSEPDLPEAQKLAWLVLGMGLDDVSNAGQARALSEAALALLGRSDEGLIAGLTQRLGIDAVSLGATGNSPRDRLGTARLAPPIPGASTSSGVSSSAAAGAARQDVVTVSKRLSSRLTLSYERGLSGLWNLVRLQYDISRRLSLRAQSGTENALDLLYFWWFD
jgi:translocation and assembly module TamB